MMLANPVVVPLYAPWEVWALAGVAMWAEIGSEVSLLRRMGWATGAKRPLVLINLATWLSFLLAVDWFSRQNLRGAHMVAAISGLEAFVVIAEALLMRAMIGRVPGAPRHPPGLGQALAVSLVGNLVSIVTGIALPVVFFWLLHAVVSSMS